MQEQTAVGRIAHTWGIKPSTLNLPYPPSNPRDRLRHLHHSALHRLLLQHHHGVVPVLPAVLLPAHPAVGLLFQQLEHGQLQSLHLHGPQRQLVQLLHLPRRGVLYVSACEYEVGAAGEQRVKGRLARRWDEALTRLYSTSGQIGRVHRPSRLFGNLVNFFILSSAFRFPIADNNFFQLV